MAAMNDRLRRLLSQKTTWLGLTSIIVIVLQSLGLDIDDPTREAITETLLVISGLVLVLVEPKPQVIVAPEKTTTGQTTKTGQPANGTVDNTGFFADCDPDRGRVADSETRPGQGEPKA